MRRCSFCDNEAMDNCNACETCACNNATQQRNEESIMTNVTTVCGWCGTEITDGMEFCCETCRDRCMEAYEEDMKNDPDLKSDMSQDDIDEMEATMNASFPKTNNNDNKGW